tara:strand:- start:497 stop:739 length:243 start_codon:yes stop_codon:yes gene_type:complete
MKIGQLAQGVSVGENAARIAALETLVSHLLRNALANGMSAQDLTDLVASAKAAAMSGGMHPNQQPIHSEALDSHLRELGV